MNKLLAAIKASFTPAQAAGWGKTIVKTFLAAAIVYALPFVQSGKQPGWADLAYAGIAGVLVAAAGWLDPADKRYGLGAQ